MKRDRWKRKTLAAVGVGTDIEFRIGFHLTGQVGGSLRIRLPSEGCLTEPPHHSCDERDEFSRIDRFRGVEVETGSQGFQSIFGAAECRQGNRRKPARMGRTYRPEFGTCKGQSFERLLKRKYL